MKRTSSNLVFLAVGAAVGAAVAYVVATDEKKQWSKQANDLVGKIKNAVCKHKDQDEYIEDAED